jgi:hypothetical protein
MKRTRVVYDGQAGSDPKGTQQIEIDGKVYTPEVIKTLVGESAAATQKSQQAQKILDAAQTYGVSADEFLQHAEGAIAVISNLQTKGLINEKGEIVLPTKETKPDTKDDDPFASILTKKPSVKPDDKGGLDSNAVVSVLQKLIDKVNTIETSVLDTKDTQTLMLRTNKEEEIKKVYPDLEEQDISKVFAKTYEARKQGKKVTLLEVAKLVNDEVMARTAIIEKKFAEAHGLNYDEIKTKRTTSRQTVADLLTAEGVSGITKGKKLSLFPKDKSKEVSPIDAISSFMRQLP